jgi:hypothetical protein
VRKCADIFTELAQTPIPISPGSNPLPSPERALPAPNYQHQKKQREQAKKKKNDEKLRRKGRAPQPNDPPAQR